jgi:hypothetical protein
MGLHRIVQTSREAAERDIADSESGNVAPTENGNLAETVEEIAQAEAEFAAHVALYVAFIHSCADPINPY